MKHSRLILGLILLYFVILGIAYAHAIPIFEASDEAEHFIYVHYILERSSLPVIQSREEMAKQDDLILRWNNQSHHAPLYYLTSALLVSWTKRADIADYLIPNELIFLRNTVEDNPNKWLHRYTEARSDTHIALYILRAFNIIIGTGTLLLVYLAAKQVFEEQTALLATFFTASIPTFIAVNASVSNDALTIFFYSAGLLWMMHVWKNEKITRNDTLLISLILAGIALIKLTGISLFGVIYLALFAGIWKKLWNWQSAAQVISTSLLITTVLSAWWYWRNFQLYGDSLALKATASIWGRTESLTLSMLTDELLRISKSFWMMIGYLHFPVFAPDSYYIYFAIITVISLIGLALYLQKNRGLIYWLMLFSIFVVTALLLYGTRSVDISYGRLLLPAIAAFAPLLIVGWRTLLKNYAGLLIVPLAWLAILAPLNIIPGAYPTLTAITEIPGTALAIQWQSGNLEILAVDIHQKQVKLNETLSLDLYIRGNHPDNPALIITAVDSIRVERLDHIEIYPGMAATNALPDDTIYRLPIEFSLDTPDTVLPPRMLTILVQWVNLEDDMRLVFDNGRDLLEIQNVIFLDPRSKIETGAYLAHFNSSDSIELRGINFPQTATSNETINLSFVWNIENAVANDWTLTIQLFDTEGNLVTQNDGVMWWYPSHLWASDLAFEDVRHLDIPADIEAGTYQIRVGWYRQEGEQFIRMDIPDIYPNINDLLILGEIMVD
jgi:hypothetical protein